MQTRFIILKQGYTNLGCQVVVTVKFCTMASNILGSSVWDLMSPFWLLGFWSGFLIFRKFCSLLLSYVSICYFRAAACLFKNSLVIKLVTKSPNFVAPELLIAVFIFKALTFCICKPTPHVILQGLSSFDFLGIPYFEFLLYFSVCGTFKFAGTF